MSTLYASGKGRIGDRSRQLRIRRRLIRYVHEALQSWMTYHQAHWTRLPKGRLDTDILLQLPENVKPE